MSETWLSWATKKPGPQEKAGYGNDPDRRLDEILAVQKDRLKNDDTSLDTLLVWEMFTAMWGVMKPIAGDLTFITRSIKTAINAAVIAGKLGGAGIALTGLVSAIMYVMGAI